MISGINKVLRNIASVKGKSEFEKRLIKASYPGDMKEPKAKHVLYLIDCLRGKHFEFIPPQEALKKIFDRFFMNLRSLSQMLKILCILHRALQDEEVSQDVAHQIKQKEDLLYPCLRDDKTEDSQIKMDICELYIDFIKSLVNFKISSHLFQVSLSDLNKHVKNLTEQELFTVLSRIDILIENIFRVFHMKSYCHKHRLFQQVVYQMFVDLIRIYQAYYLMISRILERFDDMHLRDAKRAFIIYNNFTRINKEIRSMAQWITTDLKYNLKIDFYDVDFGIVKSMKAVIDLKERQKTAYSQGRRMSSVATNSQQTESEDTYSDMDMKISDAVSKKSSIAMAALANVDATTADTGSVKPPSMLSNPFSHLRFSKKEKGTKPAQNMESIQTMQQIQLIINEEEKYEKEPALHTAKREHQIKANINLKQKAQQMDQEAFNISQSFNKIKVDYDHVPKVQLNKSKSRKSSIGRNSRIDDDFDEDFFSAEEDGVDENFNADKTKNINNYYSFDEDFMDDEIDQKQDK